MATPSKPSSSSTVPSAPLSVPSKSSGGGGAVSSNRFKQEDGGKKDGAEGVSSPAELMTFVDTLLSQLEEKFEGSSKEVLDRMTTMSSRIDSLETSLSDILNGAITGSAAAGSSVPASPVMGGGK